MDHGSQILNMNLPPGFRFHPTDEELITHYLAPKAADTSFRATVIGELDMNKFEPWDLPLSTKLGEEWYFFCMKDRKYATGLRTNRATDSGHWKATGKDKEIHKSKNLIGMRKTLVFHKGKAPKGEKTNWIMREYRLEGNQSKFKESAWVICRVHSRRSAEKKDMELVNKGSWFADEFSTSVLVSSVDDHNNNNKDRSSSATDTTHLSCFSNYLVDLNGSEELANSCYSPFLPAEDSPASSNLVELHHQGDHLVQLSENYGHSNEESFKIEEEVHATAEEIGLSTSMPPGICSSVRRDFNYQDFLPDADQPLELDLPGTTKRRLKQAKEQFGGKKDYI